MAFVSDKKGAYEYLIAYGVGVHDNLWSTVLAILGMVSVILLVSFG